MAGPFTFICNPMLSLLTISGQIIPGIEKTIVLFFDSDTNEIKCKSLINPGINNNIEDIKITRYDVVEKFRKQKSGVNWQSASTLPFESIQTNKHQLNIFDELDNIVLCIGFTNNTDNYTDWLFLYLSNKSGNLGITTTSTISTTDKNIIGALTYNTLNLFLSQNKHNSNSLMRLNNQMQHLYNENDMLKKQVSELKNSISNNYITKATEIVNSFSNKYLLKIELSTDAIEKIGLYRGSIQILEKAINQAVEIAINTNYGLPGKAVKINGWAIKLDNLNAITNNTDDNNTPNINQRYYRTLKLLDKLENAALKVAQNDLKLTGENVGNACEQPITAPAITDALKNHHKKVQSLMEQFPERWKTIRTSFKPVLNIIENANVG